ncbi:Uridine kinase [Hondaea fermentalgiana]|uniref:Uridine kinase n=1 Tax=Hondaea fermentalgiana TaxID=2315210 RepID=A0A2R5G8T2_9STRA|nr:Uridine kinase [Hondaea fermentalgiana]|eukprot:GBG27410.1 Uridine kinase [Hondaea fermentalgiana]
MASSQGESGGGQNRAWTWLCAEAQGDPTAKAVRVDIRLCGLEESVSVEKEFAERVLDPALDLVDAVRREKTDDARKIVALAGPPGVGKTLLTALIARYFESQLESRNEVVALSMDAYHLTNAELDEKGLRQRKGQPETVDGIALAKDMTRLRETPRTKLSLPVYDRVQHDPVKDALEVPASASVVLVEGIHLMLDQEPWTSLSFDAWILLFADEGQVICRNRVIARKAANKVPRQEAEQHYEHVDAPNHRQFVSDARKALARANRPALTLSVALSTRAPPLAEWHESPTCTFEEDKACLTPLDPDSAPKLVILGPNPALQKTMVFTEGIQIDQVNRAAELRKSVGGKGQQAARAATNFNAAHQGGSAARIELVQVLGGANGQAVENMLHDKGVPMRTIGVDAETRTCLTLVDKTTNEATELIEPSGELSSKEYQEFVEAIRSTCRDAAAVAICGTAPPGADSIYKDVVDQAPAQVFVDAYKGVEDALHGVTLLKINATELRKLAASGPRSDQVDSHSLFACARRLFARFAGIKFICVTDGPHLASAFARARPDRYTEFLIPKLDSSELVNPIGAGDTVLAVTAISLIRGDDIDTSFARGLAAGTASCLELGGADFAPDRLRDFFARVATAQVRAADASDTAPSAST